MPNAATAKHSIFTDGLPFTAAAAKPTAIISAGMTVCHTRSCVLSEWRLHSTIVMAPTA